MNILSYPISHRDVQRFQKWIVFAIAMMVLMRTIWLLAGAWAFDTDDAYITLRYARHLAEGQGLVWNIGENPPVEGYSNFIFVVIGAAAIKTGLDPLLSLKLLSCLALGITCMGLYRLARFWVGPLAAMVPAIVFTHYGGTIWWTVSGLESSLYQALVISAITAGVHALGHTPVTANGGTSPGINITGPKASAFSPVWAALAGSLVFLAALTRPEGPIVGIALGVSLIFHGGCAYRAAAREGELKSKRQLLKEVGKSGAAMLLAFAVPYALYFSWRYSYYERMFPNTVYWKGDYQGDPTELISDFMALAWPYIALSLIQPWRSFNSRHLMIGLFVAGYICALYGVDPIIGHWNRHFLSAFAVILVPACFGMKIVTSFLLRRAPTVMVELWLVLAALLATSFTSPWVADSLKRLATDYNERMEVRRKLANWLEERLSPDEYYAIGDCGLVPYLTHSKVFDTFGLNSREMTTPPINRSPEKYADWLMQQNPRMIVIPSDNGEKLNPFDYCGIYPAITDHPRFLGEYHHATTFHADINYFYWVFERGTK